MRFKFEKIIIQLAGPICNCDDQNLSWDHYLDKSKSEKGSISLFLKCGICGIKLYVPRDKYRASFHVASPYPNGDGKQFKKENNLILFPGGKEDKST